MATTHNGYDEPAAALLDGSSLTLDLTLHEALTLKDWLLKATSEGETALDHPDVKATLVRLGAAIDWVRAIGEVRSELETAGFATETMSDTEIAELGRRISQTSITHIP